MYVARRVVFQERELISKRASGSHIDLDKIQDSTNKEPKVGHSIQFDIERAIEETDISPPLPYRSDRGRHTPSYIRVYITEVCESLVDSNQSIPAIGSYGRP